MIRESSRSFNGRPPCQRCHFTGVFTSGNERTEISHFQAKKQNSSTAGILHWARKFNKLRFSHTENVDANFRSYQSLTSMNPEGNEYDEHLAADARLIRCDLRRAAPLTRVFSAAVTYVLTRMTRVLFRV